jgi:RNA polymerase sigma-70 factor (ECF subfamily)
MIAGVEHGQLINYVARIVGHEEAEDVVQTAYLKALGATALFRGESTMSSWVYRIAHNAACDLLKRRSRRPECQMLDVEFPCDLIVGEKRLILMQMLKKITPRNATALLTYVNEGSVEDAAYVLGITHRTLIGRMFRGRKELRELETQQ